MSEGDSDLSRLRAAAAGRDWGALHDGLTKLLMGMEFFAALEIALRRAYEHLPTFEAHHPEASWARGLLVWMASYGAAPANLPAEAGEPYVSPGASNYVAGLIELARAMERQTPLENRMRFLANAVSNMILAGLAAGWYGEHPAAWALQRERGDEIEAETGVSIRQGIYAAFWLDAETAERDRAAWLEIADGVERKMKV